MRSPDGRGLAARRMEGIGFLRRTGTGSGWAASCDIHKRSGGGHPGNGPGPSSLEPSSPESTQDLDTPTLCSWACSPCHPRTPAVGRRMGLSPCSQRDQARWLPGDADRQWLHRGTLGLRGDGRRRLSRRAQPRLQLRTPGPCSSADGATGRRLPTRKRGSSTTLRGHRKAPYHPLQSSRDPSARDSLAWIPGGTPPCEGPGSLEGVGLLTRCHPCQPGVSAGKRGTEGHRSHLSLPSSIVPA